MVGMVHRGEAQIGIANLFISDVNNPNNDVDYSVPFEFDVRNYRQKL